MRICYESAVCSGDLDQPLPPLLHLAQSRGATSGVRGNRRGASAEVSEPG